MATNAVWSGHLWLMLALVCCLGIRVKSTEEEANAYQNFLNNARREVSHEFQDGTLVARGGIGVSYLPLTPLAGGNTPVELIIAHRDLYVLGYRTVHNGQRVVYLFSDVDVTTALDSADYNRAESLNAASAYPALEESAQQTRVQTTVDAASLRTGIALLAQLPNHNTHVARLRTMLSLVMVVAEALRFTEIENRFRESLRTGVSWTPSTREAALMNSWGKLSTFIIKSLSNVGAPSSRYFSRLNEQLTVTAAMALLGVMARCFKGLNRQRRQTTEAECGPGNAVDAALADGVNGVYLFNGPNIAYVQFTPGTTDDTIIGGVKSIYNYWSFLRNTPFTYGIDAGFKVPYSGNAYIFKDGWYALIDVPNKRIINGPKLIDGNWPSLRGTNFDYSIETIFASTRTNEIYMFRGNNYALVNYAPGTTNDYIVNGPNAIVNSWPSLRGTSFANGFDASFSRPDKTEAYLFKKDQYVLINYAPGTTNDYIVNGPLKIRNGWPSLRNTAFDV